MSDKWSEYKKQFCGCKDGSRLNSCMGLPNCELHAGHPERKTPILAAPVVERQPVAIDERAEFEAETLRQTPGADLELNSSGGYMNFYLECAWNGWQQRACLDKVKELNQ